MPRTGLPSARSAQAPAISDLNVHLLRPVPVVGLPTTEGQPLQVLLVTLAGWITTRTCASGRLSTGTDEAFPRQLPTRGLVQSITRVPGGGRATIPCPRTPWPSRSADPSNLAVPPLNGPNGGGNVEGRWECIHRKRWMKGFGDLELSTRIHKERRWRGQRPVTLAVSHASRSCPHVHRYPQALELHGGNAVGRLRSPKATVHSSSASPGLRILPFDGPARASIRAHTHLTRANEALTSPMAWRLCWASRSKLLAA